MFQVKAPVVINPSTEARAALGDQLRPAAIAAWRALAGLGTGLEMAYFQIVHQGVTLAVSTRVRRNGFIEISLGMGDPKHSTRVISEAHLRNAEIGFRSGYGRTVR